jgi:hypothetical protein
MPNHDGSESKFGKIGTFAKANPYVAAAAVVLGGFSYFSARRAEKRRKKRLKSEMAGRIATVQGDIPSIQAEYGRTADLYRAQGNVAGAQIYGNAQNKMQSGGQSNLSFSQSDVNRGQMAGLLGAQLQNINIGSSQRIGATQNALASEMNQQQINIDRIRADYAKQGIPSTEVSIGDVNTLKYV